MNSPYRVDVLESQINNEMSDFQNFHLHLVLGVHCHFSVVVDVLRNFVFRLIKYLEWLNNTILEHVSFTNFSQRMEIALSE